MRGTTKAAVGGVIWIGQAAWLRPAMQDNALTLLLLTFCALVLLPLLIEVVVADNRSRLAGWALTLQFPAAICAAAATLLPPGGWAGLAALPWVAFTTLLAVIGLTSALLGGARRPLGRLCEDVALMFACVGGLWLLADRIGIRPLGFGADIVALTAVHFHYAILLTAFAGFLMERDPESRFGARGAVGVVLGVPLVAAGITINQLGWGTIFETAAGCGLALAGMVVGLLHVRAATENGPIAGRVLLAIAGASLFVGMVLAAAYALRFTGVPVPHLDIPTMRLLHGGLNAIGFGLCGVLGWRRLLAAGRPEA